MNRFIEAMEFRFACKKFDATKNISKQDFDTILESGRLTPSSFGMEPTRLLVVESKDIREKIKPLCWNQDQITQASKVVIFLSKISDMQHTSNYATRMFQRKTKKDEAALKAYKDERYGGFLQANGYLDSQSIFAWSARQAYLMASSMMDCAAFLQIDSCAIEGFDKKALEKFLAIDTFSEQIALLVTFGFRLDTPSTKSPRIQIDELVQYI